MFFRRLTSWESAYKIIVRRGNISLLYPLPPLSSSLSIFLPSLRNKSKTKVFPVHLKTVLEVVLSELIMGFSLLCSGKNAFSSETFAFFGTTISFSGARNISVHTLAATSNGIRTRQRCRNMNGHCDSRTMLRHALVN